MISKTVILTSLALLAVASCKDGAKKSAATTPIATSPEASEVCPEMKPGNPMLPGITEEHRQPEYWLDLLGAKYDLDEVLLSASEVSDLNASMTVPRKGFYPQQDLLEPIDEEALAQKVQGRFEWMIKKLDAGEYTGGDRSALANFEVQLSPRHQVALGPIQIYCAPSTVTLLDAGALDERIDKNLCSSAQTQELVQVLASAPGDMLLVRSATTWGYIKGNAPLSPPVEPSLLSRFVNGPFGVLVAERDASLPVHTRLPIAGTGSAQVATAAGFETIPTSNESFVATDRPLTRRSLLLEAFSYLDSPYGFGGKDGGIDCSRLLQGVFGSFGVKLPRHSSWQSKAGSFSIAVKDLDDEAKMKLIDESAKSGAVILHLSGHIMFYLGRDRSNTPMILHALAYYLESCEKPGGESADTAILVDRVQVSDLELGRGTAKTALIERIDRVTVLGKAPSPELRAVATMRPAAPVRRPSDKECRRLPSRRLFVSPARPHRKAPLTVVATSKSDHGAARLSFFDPRGKRYDPEVVMAGGPPYGFIAELPKVRQGNWTVALGDGDEVYACRKFRVHSSGKVNQGAEDGPVWAIKKKWGPITEDLYAVFVERLFDYPAEEDHTWPNLHTVLQNAERNVLFNHRSLDEDAILKLIPDCADLPYTLRAYFAWKLGLPYGIHECRRARDGRAPTCVRGKDNLMSRIDLGETSDLKAFSRFVNKEVRRAVHSSSGRTAPGDDVTDFYPVPLTRKALRPGTLFTDPYGHLLVVVDWIPQGTTGYGALIGADAQPDGTVGRRRFWRGSFLFHPETRSGGAGFKAFRPWSFDDESQTLVVKTNEELRHRKPVRFSKQQYKGSESDFYDKMQSLINPRPLDPMGKLNSLIDALEEQVVRRGTSVTVGESFMAERSFAPIEMPTGSKIFLTSGPWEDFSTPSRDWRLLIAIHTVYDFPDAVRRSPEQYGVAPADAETRSAQLRQQLDAALAKRSFSYKRSDGSDWQLSLKQLLDRRVEFEMSYNPNDCPEIRWAAPNDSEEISTCKRHAPEDQHLKMLEYRPWFAQRRRPAS